MSESSIRVRVTQEHINGGTRNDCGCCPVALALIDMLYECVRVDATHIEIRIGTSVRGFLTPLEVAIFVRKYDGGEEVEPFEFELELEPGGL